jgi:hypothetical protein
MHDSSFFVVQFMLAEPLTERNKFDSVACQLGHQLRGVSGR